MNKLFSTLLLPALLALPLLTPGQASANTAANTAIVNKATLTYNGSQTASSSVTVTVNLVPSTPNVNITSGTAAYTGANTPTIPNSVVITSTANGPASYTITPSVTASTNTTAPSVSVGTAVSIGASVTTGTSTTTAIRVPAGGASGNGSAINGIAVNDTIVLTVNGNTYSRVVTGTTDNGDDTFSLTLDVALPVADVPIAGIQVGERSTVNLNAIPGTVVAQGVNVTVTVQAQVSTPGAANATATTSPANSWTTPNPNVSFQKYSRNLTSASGTGALTSFTINTVTNNYYTTGVTGKSGDTIEYVIVATNNGVIDLTSCAINDVLPSAYVGNPLGAYGGKEVFYIDTTGTTSQISAGAVGANQASYVAPNLVINVGVGATAVAKGTIPASKSVTMAYQVIIK
jgi:hypothetical protein